MDPTDPLLLSLVHQYLESTKSTLADDFKASLLGVISL